MMPLCDPHKPTRPSTSILAVSLYVLSVSRSQGLIRTNQGWISNQAEKFNVRVE